MHITSKFKSILHKLGYKNGEHAQLLNKPISDTHVYILEHLLEEKLPDEIKELYTFADGQRAEVPGIFFGHAYCSSQEVIKYLEVSRSLRRESANIIEHPAQSERLLQKIIDFYRSKVPQRTFWGLRKRWYKVEFDCGLGSYGGPYLYETENTTEHHRTILTIDFKELEKIADTIQELNTLEKPSYTWEKLKFVLYSTGRYEVERIAYDFESGSHISSTPPGAIQKKYLHYKWLPLFSDYGGNYLGLDLDPDVNGQKGQVINFGPDDEDMYVFAESLEAFFDILLKEMDLAKSLLLQEGGHLHEKLKGFVQNNVSP